MLLTGSLVFTAAAMGLAASPHCASMCAGACTAVAGSGCTVRTADCAEVPAGRSWRPWLALLTGRLLSYGAAGALAAVLVGSMAWLAESLAWVRPFWNLIQAGLLGLGLWLLVQGAFPATLVERLQHWRARSAAAAPGTTGPSRGGRELLWGLAWPLVPCGVLHAALLVAALASGPAEGALVMMAFATASVPGLLLGRSLWSRLGAALRSPQGEGASESGVRPVSLTRSGRLPAAGADDERLPVRLAGAALAATAAWWLFGHRLAPTIAAWCS